MRHAILSTTKRLTDPRKMLLVAGLLAAFGLVAGYVEVQKQADHALALKQGAPVAVPIQRFTSMNKGPVDEVHVYGEIDLLEPLRLTLRNTDQTALVFPILPLSEQGAVLIDLTREGAEVTITSQIERRTDGTDPVLNPNGALFHLLPDPSVTSVDIDLLVAETYGPGRYGSVVRLNGQAADPGLFSYIMDGAFAAKGFQMPDGAVSLAPYTFGRDAALQAPASNQSHRMLYWISLALVLVALAVSFRDEDEQDRLHKLLSEEDNVEGSPARVSSHPKFGRIATQEELAEAQDAMIQPKEPHVALKAALWVLTQLGRGLSAIVGFGKTQIKNRRQRREDEAL